MAGVSSVAKVKGKELDDDCIMDLPPGFRFHPTDEEIITYYLTQKMMNTSFSAKALGEVDLNKCEPWDLPKKAKMGEKEWYFFCQRDRKYPTGMRTNRATESGYWKATGKDKEIYNNIKGEKVGGCRRLMVGMKKTLVFYKGRAPKGEKTNWVMHEYRLEGKFSYYNFPKPSKDEWVICRIFHKNTTAGTRRSPAITTGGVTKMNSFGDDDDDDNDLLEYYCPDSQQLPPLMDPAPYSNQSRPTRSGFTEDGTEDELIKGTNYYPTAGDHKNSDSIFMYHGHQTLQFPNHHQFFPFQDSQSYLHQQRMGDSAVIPSFPGSNLKVSDHHQLVQCKMEQQFSSNYQSMVTVSQDTGLSTDMTTTTTTTEISSSVISKRDAPTSNISYDELEDPSVGPFSDLDYLLNC